MNIRKTVAEVRGFMPAKGRAVISAGLGLMFIMAATGCHTVRQTDPARTATEELLISTAADRAMTNEDFSWSRGKKIFVEDKYFESLDKGYTVSLIRQCLAARGGQLTATNDKADFIVEIRSGAQSVNSAETLFGIPSTTAPLPLTGAISLPEVAFYKSTREDSISKIALFVYERESGNFVTSGGPWYGGAKYHLYKLLGIGWTRTDVPALKVKPYEKHPAPDTGGPK